MKQPDELRLRRIRRKNWIMLTVLVAFVAAVFTYSFRHLAQEVRPEAASTVTPSLR